MTYLALEGNSISNISPVAGLTNLTRVNLSNNSISDLFPVARLTNLEWLHLNNNSISDISPVAGLTNLTHLGFDNNSISDLSPLVENTGLGNGDVVWVYGNPLSYQSIHTHIPTLKRRGVIVRYINHAHSALLKASGDYQRGAPENPLANPFVVEAQDANGAALTGISVTFTAPIGGGTLNVTSATTDENGRAETTLILGPNMGINTVEVSADGIESTAIFRAIAYTAPPWIPADVNGDGVVNILDFASVMSKFGSAGTNLVADVNEDGVVNILDLVSVASEFGSAGTNPPTDVNGDGVVNILDLVSVAGMLGQTAAAPSAHLQASETLTAVEVQGWLTDARAFEVKDPIMQRGIVILEQLLVSLTPKETELLANYPNPFNPETWIPYRLAEDAFVTLTIYDGSGRLVRTIEVGHQIASAYESRSKAIYWDGTNELGERVASGVYFYHLSAGDYSATRRMLVIK